MREYEIWRYGIIIIIRSVYNVVLLKLLFSPLIFVYKSTYKIQTNELISENNCRFLFYFPGLQMLQGRASGFAPNSATRVLQQWRRFGRGTTDNFHHGTRRLWLLSLYKLKSGESHRKRISRGSLKLKWVSFDRVQTKLEIFVLLVHYGNFFFRIGKLLSISPLYLRSDRYTCIKAIFFLILVIEY